MVKLIQFFLMPLYTTLMTTEQYGVAELVNNFNELLYPVACLCIYEAMFRFSLDDDSDKGEVFSNGVALLAMSIPISILVGIGLELFARYEYALLCAVLIASSATRAAFAQFARGVGKVKEFAVSGIINALFLLVGSIAMIGFMKLGIIGYLLNIIVANIISATYIMMVVNARLIFSAKKISISYLNLMVLYSIPLLPNQLSWWFVNTFSRYVVLFFCGPASAGLFAAASKLPSLVNFLSAIFQQAWQISAAQEINKEGSQDFFSVVFAAFSAFILTGTSFLIAISAPLCFVLLRGDFFEAWIYVPMLLASTAISCYSAYFGTFYNATKETSAMFISTLCGAIICTPLCILLVNVIGVWGALVSALVAQIVVFLYRFIDSRKYANVSINVWYHALAIALITLQVYFVSSSTELSVLVGIAFFICVLSLSCLMNKKILNAVFGLVKSHVRKQ